MRTSPVTVLSSLTAAAILVLSIGASVAFAKEGVSVNLSAPLPGDAAPGTTVAAFFTMQAISDDVASPLHKASVFMRLYGPTGAMTEAPGVEQATPGLYKAMIEIPAGGIIHGEFGIHGQAKTSTGKVVATDPVWSYDGLLVSAKAPAPVDPNAYQVPAAKPQPANGGTAAVAPAASGAPASPATLDPRLAVAAILALVVGAAAVVAGRRRRLRHSPA